MLSETIYNYTVLNITDTQFVLVVTYQLNR
jgi:hypothetical protein